MVIRRRGLIFVMDASFSERLAHLPAETAAGPPIS